MRSAVLIATLLPCLALGQIPTAMLDTAVMRIGEQVSLILSVDLAAGEVTTIEWPEIGTTLSPNVEVVLISGIDTVRTPMDAIPDIIHLEQRLTITSFDTGYWAIAPFQFLVGGRPVETTPLLLEVQGVDLGDEPRLRDIKPVHEADFSMMAWLHANWYWIVIPLLIAVLVWWLIQKWRARPAPAEVPVIIGAEIPVDERILAELRSLESERLWQNGAHKEYHSRLTDLLREYIEERYQVPALERTTDELLQELRVSAISRDHLLQLRNMLQLSDLVKFAKAIPSPIENEHMMTGAVRFVQETAPAPPVAVNA